ncbi:MAG: helix-hairpin-helix domain-containing protein [Gammaproteobacteria bacterium]|nr:helix-hairpin-helix domain-containing protein [Gammaproteobacteria bacterium]
MSRSKRILLSIVCACLFPLASFAGPVDVNTASAETISAELKGVGMSKAKAIVEYRLANGPFKTPADLMQVKGIGARTIEINASNILVKTAPK